MDPGGGRHCSGGIVDAAQAREDEPDRQLRRGGIVHADRIAEEHAWRKEGKSSLKPRREQLRTFEIRHSSHEMRVRLRPEVVRHEEPTPVEEIR